MPVIQLAPRWLAKQPSSGWRDHATQPAGTPEGDTGITKLRNPPPRLLPPPSPRMRAASCHPGAQPPRSCTLLALRLLLGAKRILPEVACVGFRVFFLLLLLLLFYLSTGPG